MYLVCQNNVSNKFWEIEINGNSFQTHWGRIGTAGQSTVKTYYDSYSCQHEAQKLIASKRKKGYVDAITPELLQEAFIRMFSGIAEYKSPGEFYYSDDKFHKMATIQFLDGGSDHLVLRHYYDNGRKKSETEWVDGKKNGFDIGWYWDGSIEWKREYKDGKIVGRY